MVEVVIRKYRPGDAKAMFALDRECFAEPFRFSGRAMRAFAEARDAITLVASEAEGGLTAFVIVHEEERTGARCGYVVTLDVASPWRRNGLALRLMHEAELRLIERAVERMALHVHTENEAAVRFYERAGYERTGFEPNFYGAGRDALVYSKQLT